MIDFYKTFNLNFTTQCETLNGISWQATDDQKVKFCGVSTENRDTISAIAINCGASQVEFSD